MPTRRHDPSERAHRTQSNRTILVVSPDTAWSDALRRRLAAWIDTAGTVVLTTSDSARAGVYFDRLQPAVVVLDAVALDAEVVRLIGCRAASRATVLVAGPVDPEAAPLAFAHRIDRSARAVAAAVQRAVPEQPD